MAVDVNVDGIIITVTDTDDPVLAKRAATRYVKKQKGEYSSLGEAFIKGPIRGLQEAFLEGPTTLASTAYDAVMGTDYTSGVEKFFEKVKVEKPIGKIGQATEFLTQFGVPSHLATKAVRKRLLKKEFAVKKAALKKGEKLGKKKMFTKAPTPRKLDFMTHTVAPVAVADFIAAGQSTPDLGLVDFLHENVFDGSASDEDAIQALTNREKAANRFLKRIGIAAEGAGIMLALPKIWKTKIPGVDLNVGIKPLFEGTAALLSKSETVTAAAKWAQKAKEAGRAKLNETQFKTDKTSKFLNKVRGGLRFGGHRPAEVAEAKARQAGFTTWQMDRLNFNLYSLNKGMQWLKKKGGINDNDFRVIETNLNTALFNPDKAKRAAALARLKIYDKTLKKAGKAKLGYLEDGTKVMTPKFSLIENVKNSRKQIDNLSEDLLKNKDLLPPGMAEAIEANLQSYGYTAYKTFIRGETYLPPPEMLKAVKNELIIGKVAKNQEEAEGVLENILRMGSKTDNAFMVPEYALDGIKGGLLKGKKLADLPQLRKYLGEVTGKDLPSLMTKTRITVDNLTRLTSGMRYLDEVAAIDARIPLKGVGSENKFLYNSIDEVPEARKAAFINPETNLPYRIGGQSKGDAIRFGPINGKITTRLIRDAVTGANKGWLENFGQGVSTFYGSFLGLKSLVQQFKTIYSPITQIRNLTSASLFPAMSGNLVSGQTLQDSAAIVLDALKKQNRGDLSAYYRKGQDYGVINTGSQLKEITGIVDDAALLLSKGESDSTITRKIGQGLLNVVRRGQNNFAAKLYQGSDDVWKIVSWEMEQGRLARAFRNAEKEGRNVLISKSDFAKMKPKNKLVLENSVINKYGKDWNKLTQIKKDELIRGGWSGLERSAQNEIITDIGAGIVRDTVPNYARVSPWIKALRKSPFGNFIAFPAETFRTSMNVASRAIDEIASGVPELAEIGMRRLMGSMAVMYGIPKSMVEFGKYMTGADDEQILAFKRSFANPWEKNADLVPIRTDNNGNIVEFYNYTYTNPYEYMRAPFLALFNAVANGEKRGDKLHEVLMQAAVGSRDNPGAIIEWLEPFFGESIATEGLVDILRNATYSRGKRDEIWNAADDAGTIISKGIGHLTNLYAPPLVPVKFIGGVTNPVLKDLPRATLYSLGISDKPITRKGKQANLYKQLAESFTGLKTIEPTLKRVLYFRGVEANEGIRYASTLYSRVASDPNILNPEEHVKALLATNEIRFEAVRDLSMAIEDAKRLGMTDAQVLFELKRAKVANPKAVMQRLFIPYFPTEYQIKKALDKEPAAGVPYFPEAELRQSWMEQIKPTLPKASFAGPMPVLPSTTQAFDARGYPMRGRPRRLTAQQKAAQDPRGSAAVLLRQKELEKMLGIN